MKKNFAILAVITIAFASCKKDGGSAPHATAPVVTTAALTNLNAGAVSASVTAGGSIVSDGGASITKSGVVWSKTNNTPTTADSMAAGTTATGPFTNNITGLELNTPYYFRAFATNSAGTGYGDVVTLTTSSETVSFTYNGQSVTYGIVTSPATGKKWLDRNLGAQRAATAFDDYLAYGDLFQWGRADDGHQLINWTSSTTGTPVNGITATLATSDIPGHNKFIDGSSNYDYQNQIGSGDWRADNNRNRWATLPKGPCPTGWHVPSRNEWLSEVSTSAGGTSTSGGITRSSTAFSNLKLTGAGFRVGFTGNGENAGDLHVGNGSPGSMGFYWCSTDQQQILPAGINGPFAQECEIASSFIQQFSVNKGAAMSVRCVHD